MSEPRQAPEWLVAGAPVVVYDAYARSGGVTYITKIRRVSKQSFTLELDGERYLIDTQERRVGGAWGVLYRVVPVDSVEARRALAAANRRRRETKARDLFEAWLRDKSEWNRLAVIAALEALTPDKEGL